MKNMNTITDADLLLVAAAMSAAEGKDTEGFDVREWKGGGEYGVRVRYFQRAIVAEASGLTSDEARANLLTRMIQRLRAASPGALALIEAELASRAS